MKKICSIAALLLSLSLFFGCSEIADTGRDVGADSETSSDTADDGKIFSEEYSPGEIMDYFFEVAFGSEYGSSSDRLCRWSKEVLYEVNGDCTDDDRELMQYLFDTLNGIDGFPGIREPKFGEKANFTVSFVTRDEICEMFEYADETCAGMSEYTWLTDTCEIISARAAIDCEEVYERESTICEEILQAMGIGNDSLLYQNSVFFQGMCLYKKPSSLDIAVIKLLYSPMLTLGMTKAEAVPVAATALRW